MKIAIIDIPEEGLSRQYTIPVSVLADHEPFTASASLRITKAGTKVIVQGDIHIKGSLTCSRCLEDFDEEMDLSFLDECNPLPERITEPEYELSKEELDVSYYEHDEIDLDELIKEQVLLSIPIKPLCRPECKGLCLKCGKNLNEGECGCERNEIDSRLEILKKLKNSMKRGEE